MVGSLTSTCDLLRAGILLAESLVILASTVHRHDERLIFASTVHRHDERLENKEVLSDADHITAVNSIAKLFPHVRLTIQVKFRYNIRFISTTPYEQSALHRLSRMVRKGDHLTYLFLPQVSSSKAYSSSMLDTLLYQSVTKPHIITLFRQLLGCHQVDGSGFIWKVLVSEELARLGTYVRMFQRLAASYSFISMAIYRSAPITPTKHDDLRDNFKEEHLEKNWKYLMGELHSLGINREVEHLKRPLHQEFIYLNPPPDFTILEGDIVLGLRPPLTDTSSCHQSHTHKSQTLPMESETEFIPETHHPELAIPVEPVNNTNNNTTMGTDIQVKVIVTDNT
jgi:potassium channel subfamily T protein 1